MHAFWRHLLAAAVQHVNDRLWQELGNRHLWNVQACLCQSCAVNTAILPMAHCFLKRSNQEERRWCYLALLSQWQEAGKKLFFMF